MIAKIVLSQRYRAATIVLLDRGCCNLLADNFIRPQALSAELLAGAALRQWCHSRARRSGTNSCFGVGLNAEVKLAARESVPAVLNSVGSMVSGTRRTVMHTNSGVARRARGFIAVKYPIK